MFYSLHIVAFSPSASRLRSVFWMFGVVSCCCRIVISYMLSRSGRKWSHTSFALSCYNDIIEGFPSMTIVSHFSFFFVYLLFCIFSRGFFFVRVNRKSEIWCFVGGFFRLFLLGERVEEKKGRYEFISYAKDFFYC